MTDDGRTVTVEIYASEPDPSSTQGDRRCRFRLTGALQIDTYGRGADGLQALVNALVGVRKYLDESGMVLTWDGLEPGDHHVPMIVPRFFGLIFTRELEGEIDRRLTAHRPPWAP